MADLKKKEVSRSRMAEFPAGTPLRSGDEFPTEDIICEALENKSFERLNNCLVIASSDEHDMRFINEETLNIYFRDDVCKRAARTVLTGMCYSFGNATRQGSSSLTRFIGQSAITSSTWRR